MTKKLTIMPYANARVEIYEKGNYIRLISYNTIVADLIDDVVTVHGLYSATTRKHISAFMREYCGSSYAVAKALYENHMSMDITTGECFEIN